MTDGSHRGAREGMVGVRETGVRGKAGCLGSLFVNGEIQFECAGRNPVGGHSANRKRWSHRGVIRRCDY